jgi:hypothetical protein
MVALFRLLASFVADLFKPRHRLEAEILFLRHQLNIALRQRPARLPLRGSDRVLLLWITRLWPSLLDMVQVVEPATILRWHRAGFRSYWRWKSRKRSGRPRIDRELRDLIRRMSQENPLWGAPRIHGEVLKLGFELAESTVSKYMIRRRHPPSQSWKTFLRNHAEAIAAIDLCVVPTVHFERLFAFIIIGHGRRRLLWFAVTRHPTAEWLAHTLLATADVSARSGTRQPALHLTSERAATRSLRRAVGMKARPPIPCRTARLRSLRLRSDREPFVHRPTFVGLEMTEGDPA